MASIKLSDGRVFKYKVYPLYLGIKKIDREKAKENLLLLKKITDKAGLKFALAFGTALGAIREHNFIETYGFIILIGTCCSPYCLS